METNTGKVREICQAENVGTMAFNFNRISTALGN